MPDGKYYRAQAQLCARLALTTSDPKATARYNELALEYLAKAEDLEPEAAEPDAAESRQNVGALDRSGDTGRP